jgi:5-methyltetrahydropteroyltriglutamate--homocysteine methyltransferase
VDHADIVGRERVIASADCGFATFAGRKNRVVPSVAWAKLGALVDGAKIATDRLWK